MGGYKRGGELCPGGGGAQRRMAKTHKAWLQEFKNELEKGGVGDWGWGAPCSFLPVAGRGGQGWGRR